MTSRCAVLAACVLVCAFLSASADPQNSDRSQQRQPVGYQHQYDRSQQRQTEDLTQQRQTEDLTQQRQTGDFRQQRQPEDLTQQRQTGDFRQQRQPEDLTQQRQTGDFRQQRQLEDLTQQRQTGDFRQQRQPEDLTQQRQTGDFRQQWQPEDLTQQRQTGDFRQQSQPGDLTQQRQTGGYNPDHIQHRHTGDFRTGSQTGDIRTGSQTGVVRTGSQPGGVRPLSEIEEHAVQNSNLPSRQTAGCQQQGTKSSRPCRPTTTPNPRREGIYFPHDVIDESQDLNADHSINSVRNQHAALQLSRSNLEFTHNMYKLISEQQPGNVFFSPLSIHAILAMASLGAKGPTRDQLNTGLALEDEERTKRGYQFYLSLLNNLTDSSMTVKVANKIYVKQFSEVKENFKALTREYFHSECVNINFFNAELARRTINSFIEDNTNQKIKNMIAQGTLTSSTAMVLANAVYMKGDWMTKFNSTATKIEKFYVTPSKPVDVQMMYASGNFRVYFHRTLDCKVLELPYKNEDMIMTIVLPNQMDGLADLERKLSPSLIRALILDPERQVNINLHLPRFKLEEETKLAGILRQMGMEKMFSSSADFSGISTGGVRISEVAHKSFIEVNEEGSEAAAATIVATVALSTPTIERPIEFNANHPFLFLVRHVTYDHVLFMGRFSSPPSTLQRPGNTGRKH